MSLTEKKFKLEQLDVQSIIGPNDSFLNILETRFQSSINVRGSLFHIKGPEEEVKLIENIIRELGYIIEKNGSLEQDDVYTVIEMLASGVGLAKKNSEEKRKYPKDNIVYWGFKDAIRTRNSSQARYQNSVLSNDMVFAIGPAGTGKTFLAVAMALAELKKGTISKIILSRPAVEAGESLGFLPGDLKEKLDPYLRPLLDALFVMVGPEKLSNLMDKNIIEIIPLAYMRGRTLTNSFIILDEAQNATVTQMKMFLTRMGEDSKVIVTGDITQIDLPSKTNSGLVNANKVLQNIKGIDFVYFDKNDVVRHKLVTDIINAYENDNREKTENITSND